MADLNPEVAKALIGAAESLFGMWLKHHLERRDTFGAPGAPYALKRTFKRGLFWVCLAIVAGIAGFVLTLFLSLIGAFGGPTGSSQTGYSYADYFDRQEAGFIFLLVPCFLFLAFAFFQALIFIYRLLCKLFWD